MPLGQRKQNSDQKGHLRPTQQIRPAGPEVLGGEQDGERDRRMAEKENQNTLNQMTLVQSYRAAAYNRPQLEAPPPFDGSRARLWLRQIEQYQ